MLAVKTTGTAPTEPTGVARTGASRAFDEMVKLTVDVSTPAVGLMKP